MPLRRVRKDEPSKHRDFAETVLRELRKYPSGRNVTIPYQVREFFDNVFIIDIHYRLFKQILCGLHCHGSPVILYESSDKTLYVKIDYADEIPQFIRRMQDERLDLVSVCDYTELRSL